MVRSCKIASLVLLALNLASAKRELDDMWDDTLLNSYLEQSHSKKMVHRIKAHAYTHSNNTEGYIQAAWSPDPTSMEGTTNFMPAFRCQGFKANGVDIPGLCSIPGTGKSYTTYGGQGGLHGNHWWPMDEMDLSAVPYTVRAYDGQDSVTLMDELFGIKDVKFKKTTQTCLPNESKFQTGSADEAAASGEKVRCDCLKTKEECLGSYIEAGRVKPGQKGSGKPTFYSATNKVQEKFIMRVCMWNENKKLGNWCSISYTFIPMADASQVNDVCDGGVAKCPAMTGTGPDCPGEGKAPCEVSAHSQSSLV